MERITRSCQSIMRRTVLAYPPSQISRLGGNSLATSQLSSAGSAAAALQAARGECLGTVAGLLPAPPAALLAALRHLQSSEGVPGAEPVSVAASARSAPDSQSWAGRQRSTATANGISQALRPLQQAPPLFVQQGMEGRHGSAARAPAAPESAAYRPPHRQRSGGANQQAEPRNGSPAVSRHTATQRAEQGSERPAAGAALREPAAPAAAPAKRAGGQPPLGGSRAAAQQWLHSAAAEVAASEEDPSAAPESLVRSRCPRQMPSLSHMLWSGLFIQNSFSDPCHQCLLFDAVTTPQLTEVSP